MQVVVLFETGWRHSRNVNEEYSKRTVSNKLGSLYVLSQDVNPDKMVFSKLLLFKAIKGFIDCLNLD